MYIQCTHTDAACVTVHVLDIVYLLQCEQHVCCVRVNVSVCVTLN